MHKNKILHRDIKPENIVLVHVIMQKFRVTWNYVILGGQSTKKKNLEVLSAVRHSTYHPNYYKDQDMMKK